jgi:flagellar hook-length control protein FliK
VARLLQQTRERLRQELATGQFIQVSIGTGSESSSARDQSRPQEQRLMAEESIQATSRAAPATQLQSNQLHAKQSPASDVLVTV